MNDSADNHLSQVVFDTARLRLRALRDCDEALYCDLFSDAETMRFIGPPWSRERAARSFRIALKSMQTDQPKELFLTVIEKATNRTIGVCTIQKVDLLRGCAEVGIMLKPASHARGLAKEAVAAATTQAFARFPIDEVRGQFAAGHAIAEGVVRSIGFSPAGDTGFGDPELRTWSIDRRSWLRNTTL